MSLSAQGRYDEALQVAAEPNPFPCICGRVCTAPCEDVCRRGEFDAPIAIRDLKRFATDHGKPAQRKIAPPKDTFDERVAIVGAGPTGLSAAYYLARRGYKVLVATPYGPEWYPYLMRRLGERPANLLFFVRSTLRG